MWQTVSNLFAFKSHRVTPDAAVMRGNPPPSVAVFSQFFQTHSLADLLNYYAYSPETKLYHHAMNAPFIDPKALPKSYGFILDIQTPAGASDEMARVLLGLFNQQYVTGATLQFCLWASPEISPLLNHWIAARKPGSIYERMARRRAEYLSTGVRQSLFKDSPYLLRNFRATVAVFMPGEANEHDVVDALSLRDGLTGVLRSAGFPATPLEPDGLLNLLDEMLNPAKLGEFKAKPLHYDDSQPLREQIMSRETILQMDKDGMVIGDKAIRCLSVKDYPKEATLAQMTDMIGDFYQETLQIPCPFVSTLCIQIPDAETLRRTVNLKSARAIQTADSPMAKFLPDLARKGREWQKVQDDVDAGIMLTRIWHGITLYAQLGLADQAENQIKSLYMSKGWGLQVDRFLQVQSFLASLPGRFDPHLAADFAAMKRLRTVTQFNAVNTLPAIGEWSGTRSPLLLLSGRRGQVMYIDMFDNNQGNYNGAVVASSGAGKSFFLNEIVSSVVGTGGRAWIIDVGRSYERTCKLLGGQFIEFTEQSGININPFTHIREFDDDEMSMLKQIVAQAIASEGLIDDLSMSWIEQAIGQAWREKANAATFSDIARLLLAHPDKRAQDMGQILFPYTSNGVYGRFFEGRSTLTFDNEFIVLELEELKSKKELQGVVLLIIMLRIQQEMYLGDRDRRKVCIIDEAWDLMNGGQAGKFIETGYRRVRKYGGAFLTATQSINDYYKNTAAQAAWENSDWVFMLRQKEESIEQLKKSGRFNVDEFLGRLLRSIRTRHGEYSEVYIHTPSGGAVGRLIVDKFTAKVYSTKAEEVHAVNQLVAQGHSLADAVEVLVRQEAARHD
ncbi:type IV secretion system protein TraC [Thiothrix lacustris]|jgi:conjugal transfer ATP-binding protein TraC|uniref:type IV secretion system protein TraC n=1 Tax=Thiothrix lacustris TaxID=525917 RepID=UPI0027E3E2B9|nr:type IV secretion system protein TraC [Thiothrix lacustris]WMP17318.1 type IV secretion system protein TraC [Thiothrix lacustris]